MNRVFDRVNSLSAVRFVELFGPIYEHSPWIAQRAHGHAPFTGREAMLAAMALVLEQADEAEKMALIRAHPELAQRMGVDPTLTSASAAEQASAGLDRLTPDEFSSFRALNEAYAAKFGMPFIICVRRSDKQAILNGLRTRLDNTPQAEQQTALAEINKIAALRLADVLERLEHDL
ncbi:2-oxo-4-hydroxy-4-carboxy-5-ureidoimidazoline decarboxylase [Komagataeibacter sp. AV436]|uniref:2-oxo-4-hydroxy-4-carboxy-5-ureidoimidazoline decarboxylase n=1 Tax=Komagataeibacter melomenusus TaxID=2766578 RepID=A0ABX2ADD7_9PROT|nr:2-oxo-4-hydroxy-4-carboxy-5-ureidoimidazoline decarboxylase [Komagataeibacter melomenusus]MBV1830630.1 2-oxo-4-hydroxy-4-carboxy-5-ureidoimidazoline decarboxylase [Komagataeibacter melomenusus]NPC66312.1 2-oxo-4-hydroxy-4-carboxy-5-ureidoimidazoline decarboxylase [Komagataeibacter melomenusus]